MEQSPKKTTEKVLKNKACCRWPNDLKRHVKRAHPVDDSQMKQCTLCDYKTMSSQHLKRHVQNRHEARARSALKCRYCSYQTSAMDNLRKHVLKTTHHQGLPLFFCPLCREFLTNDTPEFRLHLSDEHGKDKHSIKQLIDEFFLPSQEEVTVVGGKLTQKVKKNKRKQQLPSRKDI